MDFWNENTPYPNIDHANLSNNFWKYFVEKVDKIVEKINIITANEQMYDIVKYEDIQTNLPILENFKNFTNKQIQKIIMETSTETETNHK